MSDVIALLSQQRPGKVLAADCPSREILNHVTSRWGVLVLIALLEDTYRFSELRRKIEGVSERMLAKTLSVLVDDGFVLRTSYPVIPPQVDYCLTDLGREMAIRMADLTMWIESNLPQILDDAKAGSSKR